MTSSTIAIVVSLWLVPSAAAAQLLEMRQTIFGMD
jgi:hypothetical protein